MLYKTMRALVENDEALEQDVVDHPILPVESAECTIGCSD